MYNTIRYSHSDFEVLFKKIYKLKDKIVFWSAKTSKIVFIETNFFYNMEDDLWEGELGVIYEKEIK